MAQQKFCCILPMHEERQASSEWMVQSQLNNSESYHMKKGKPRNSPLSIGPKKPSDHPAEQTPNILQRRRNRQPSRIQV
jgi:hypothetical protein